jgi:hypothetical protein
LKRCVRGWRLWKLSFRNKRVVELLRRVQDRGKRIRGGEKIKGVGGRDAEAETEIEEKGIGREDPEGDSG